MLELLRIEDVEDKHGLRFAMADCRMLDYPEQATLSALILLDTLDAPGPGLGAEDQENFFRGVMEEYRHIENRRARLEAVRNDPYYNALHIKFAYALTCHKTQGGQWENVFIDQGYLSDEMVGRSYLRWLYTALTRASGRVYLIGFREEMIAEETASDQ
jgi:exodeoxyribonuclease-5